MPPSQSYERSGSVTLSYLCSKQHNVQILHGKAGVYDVMLLANDMLHTVPLPIYSRFAGQRSLCI